eukprot:TRINITY_DN3799_c0_g1_i1.p1 TRINITY_DN3799_c0_g1~~TRINITY_DN3799_c0_g1_i1.p1  ORF type:complete len:448 (-),score=116.47 TRINITY_DN3799_c0_g1_i1:201-1544(-)
MGHSICELKAPVDIPSLSVRELKLELSSRGVDFSNCREKRELQDLLKQELERTAAEADAETGVGVSEEEDSEDYCGFAVRLTDSRHCWVEFVDEGSALCHFDDGTDGIVPASDLRHIESEELSRSSPFDGSFEAARAEAFNSGRLLVAAVNGVSSALTNDESKDEGVQSLVFNSEEVSLLLQENAIYWKGSVSELRDPHVEQLAPSGTPSVAMVLPLAVDAMKVLATPDGTCKEKVVGAIVEALEAFEAHQQAVQARLLSEDAQLRMEQDEEFAASLAADRERLDLEEALRLSAEEAAKASKDSTQDAKCEEAQVQDTCLEERAESPTDDSSSLLHLVETRRAVAERFISETDKVSMDQGTARLVLRLPTGERVERTFAASEPLSRVLSWAECCQYLPEGENRDLKVPASFDISTSFPRRLLSSEEGDKSLVDLGLVPSAALMLNVK